MSCLILFYSQPFVAKLHLRHFLIFVEEFLQLIQSIYPEEKISLFTFFLSLSAGVVFSFKSCISGSSLPHRPFTDPPLCIVLPGRKVLRKFRLRVAFSAKVASHRFRWRKKGVHGIFFRGFGIALFISSKGSPGWNI